MLGIFLQLQIIYIIAALACSYLIIVKWNNKLHSYLFISALATLINSIGYFIELSSNSIEMMNLGTKVAYIGRPIVSLGMLLFTAEFCKFTIPRIAKLFMFIYSIAMSVVVATNQYHHLFYTDMRISDEGLFTHIVYGHGPLYYAYMVLNALYFLTICIITIRRIVKVNKMSEKEQIVYIFLMSAVVIFGLVLMITGQSGGYDTTQPAFFACTILFVLSLFRCDIMETIEIVKDFAMDNLDEGVIAINNYKKGEIIFYNPTASKIYPELTKNGILHIEDLGENPIGQEYIFKNDKVYKVVVTDIKKFRRKVGKMVVLSDYTAAYNYTSRLEEEVNKKTEEIAKIQGAVIVGIADVVEARDGFTGEHIKNTQNYVKIIVDTLKDLPEFKDIVDEDYARRVIDAAPLHDIGKISVPDSILGKPGKLTDEEFEIIKQHSEDGANIIKQTLTGVEDETYLSTAYDIAMYHHEKWNGTGYPMGLIGEEIPLSARIMAVADVYDALRCKRSYKGSMTHEQAKEIMMGGKDSHFDGRLVDIFFNSLEAV